MCRVAVMHLDAALNDERLGVAFGRVKEVAVVGVVDVWLVDEDGLLNAGFLHQSKHLFGG